MRFLLEADSNNSDQNIVTQSGNSLLDVKKTIEQKNGSKRYEDLHTTGEQLEFIGKVVDRAKNRDTLRKARHGVIYAIKDSKWNPNIIAYLDKLDSKYNIQDSEIKLIGDLIKDNKISINDKWLYDKNLYDRDIGDSLYTIKALTLAGNKDLQTSTKDGKEINKFFKEDNPLKVSDLYDDERLRSADEIEEIIAEKEDPDKEYDYSHTYKQKAMRQKAKDIAKQNDINIDVDALFDSKNQKIVQELGDALTKLGLKPYEINRAISDSFEEGQTTEFILNKILQNRG